MANKLLCLDWDDTLMPSRYILSNIHYRKDGKTFSFKGDKTALKPFISNLEITGNATFQLLQKICKQFDPKNIKIVTNGMQGWLNDSLFIAGTFCDIYIKIIEILNLHKIEIIYARNGSLQWIYWKTKAMDLLLGRHFNKSNSLTDPSLNIITVGDQWTDHNSVKLSVTYSMYSKSITHHQIKLYEKADCRYLGVELKYITKILDEEICFNQNEQKDLVLEFDGYTNVV
eukprot:181739_1